MQLAISLEPGTGYKSGCQITRRRTEAWGAENLYCVSCHSRRLEMSPCNTPATDFQCPACSARYQLKARTSWSETKVADAAYSSMIEAIRANETPNLFVLQYDR